MADKKLIAGKMVTERVAKKSSVQDPEPDYTGVGCGGPPPPNIVTQRGNAIRPAIDLAVGLKAQKLGYRRGNIIKK